MSQGSIVVVGASVHMGPDRDLSLSHLVKRDRSEQPINRMKTSGPASFLQGQYPQQKYVKKMRFQPESS